MKRDRMPVTIPITATSGAVDDASKAWLYRDEHGLGVYVSVNGATIGFKLSESDLREWLGAK